MTPDQKPLTPRTDELWEKLRRTLTYRVAAEPIFEHARQLETELAAQEVQMNAVRYRAEQAERELSEMRRERDDEAEVRERLAQLLAGVAIALKGPEAPLQGHDWSDLPKVAAELHLANELAEHMLKQTEQSLAQARAALIEIKTQLDYHDRNAHGWKNYVTGVVDKAILSAQGQR